jgi:chemotaxis family two-component system sensor kinase Cph1
VIGEDGNGVLPSYLGLSFPPSDIPAQARELYRLNRVRQIPDAGYTPVPIDAEPGTGTLDLSFSVLRSVSPVHVEYMRNMGTAASMSVSVVVDGRLWGLVSCHNANPKRVPPAVRGSCDFIAQILSMRIAAQAIHADAADRVALQGAQARLLTAMADGTTWYEGLAASEDSLLAATRSTGAAIVRDEGCMTFGDTPDEAEIRSIAAWLDGTGRDLVATSTLPADMGQADPGNGVAGLLAVSLSRMHADWLVWFRPEVVRTVTWGGDPRKPAEGPEVRISPRKSFEAWRETVRGTARPWTAAEVDAARAMRTAIVDIVLRKAEELAALSEDLRRSNKELEAFSYSISHDLRAPFRHIVGYAELLAERERGRMDEKSTHYLRNISEAAETAGRLVDDLLHFAQMGRVKIVPVRVDVNKLVTEVCRSLALEIRDRKVEWRANDMPVAFGDPSLLRQVLFNLVSNAVKYTRGRDPAVIEIGGWSGDTETTYYVRDNGIGFDMAYAEKLFQVFQRLNRTEEFEGTGIGLALVRRIVERHGGRTWASGQLGRGATFYFAIPAPKEGAH